MAAGRWVVQQRQQAGAAIGMPYLITLASQDGRALRFLSKHVWPPVGGNVFVKRCSETHVTESLEEIESCRAVDVKVERGEKATTVSVVLDRARRKRCSFLLVTKDGQEVAYFRTESGIKAHRSKGYLQPTSTSLIDELVVDSRERYAWSFAAERQRREALPAGDYALRVNGRIEAVIERKTLTNLLANLSALESYHVHLQELATYPISALVVEANYADLGNPKKVNPMSATRCLRAVAAISARHPNLQVIFAGNRKQANIWAAHLFAAASARVRGQDQQGAQQDLPIATGPSRDVAPTGKAGRGRPPRTNVGGLQEEIRQALTLRRGHWLGAGEVRALFPGEAPEAVSACLKRLRGTGVVVSEGRARGTRWRAASG
jgi:hypothetical protein